MFISNKREYLKSLFEILELRYASELGILEFW